MHDPVKKYTPGRTHDGTIHVWIQSRSYDWACKGRSAELAAWQHLVLGRELGTGRATALLDMTKCFEQVRLWHVWRWGCHWDFPRGLLRVILLVFSFQRRVGLWGATSEPTQTYAAIIAGSVFSCAILHMLFIWPCDCLMSRWPRLRLTKYVDDLTLSCSGRNRAVADTIAEASSPLIGWLESGLDFHVSKDENGKEGKSVVLASNRILKGMLAAKVKPLDMRVVSHARLLGVDTFGAGMARRRKTQYGRLDRVKKRLPKVKFFKKYGATTSKIARAGFLPSGLHGVRCLGLPPTRVKALRTTIGQCLPGKHAGRSLTWRLAVHECDPIHTCRVEPIVAWAEAVWDKQLDDAELHRAWRQQQRRVGMKPRWSRVSGPTGATIMCLRQLGWTWPHHTTFVTSNGHLIDLRETCPMDVKAQAGVDSDLALWQVWADTDERKELLPRPLVEPVVRLSKRAQRHPREAPAIRAALGVIQGGWWTQEVANSTGASDHPFCLKCEPAVMGTAMHRVWTCPIYHEVRSDLAPNHLHLDTVTGSKLMWEKGLMHDPVERYTPGRTHDGTAHFWIHPNARDSCFGGKLFVDGSLLSKHGAQGGQAGWAVVQVDEASHELVCTAHGAMPVTLPVQRRIMRAELWALLQALSLSEPGASFISDCATVLRGIERGEKWCTAGRRPHADVWREIWRLFRGVGKEAQVDSVVKCKAHLTKAERAKLNDEGRLAAAGNEWADRLAKDGAGDDSFQATMCGLYKTAVRTCTDIITYIGNFIVRAKTGDRWPDVTPPPQGWQEKDERWKRVKPTLERPHLLVRSGRQWNCDNCGRHASDGPSKFKLARTECVGHPAEVLGDEARPQLHLLVQTGSFVWCCRCGARAAKFAKSLSQPCMGRPRSQEYARSIRLLSSGWHPKENRFLGAPKLFTERTWSKWRLEYQGAHLAKAGKGELRQAVVRLREAQARPCMLDEKKHLLLATGQIKWCWRCGARVEKDSAPRLLLKTACSGAPRTKEYERAISLLGKGQHPKSSESLGPPSRIGDEEWGAWQERHGNLPFCGRELSDR